MPYKSEAQRRKFHQMLKEGKISKEVVSDFDESSKGARLPERAPLKKYPKNIDDVRRILKRRGSK